MIYDLKNKIGVSAAHSRIDLLSELGKQCTIPVFNNTRTNLQNRALHLWFKQVADFMNSKGIPFIIMGIDCLFTETIVKDIFKQLASVLYDIDSTTKLNTQQINEIFDFYSKRLSETTGEYVEFPSMETLLKRI